MVSNIFEARLIILFIEGLVEPRRGLVRSYRSISL